MIGLYLMNDKVPRTVYIDTETDDELGHVAYNLKCNKLEVMRRLIEKGLEEGILEDYEDED